MSQDFEPFIPLCSGLLTLLAAVACFVFPRTERQVAVVPLCFGTFVGLLSQFRVLRPPTAVLLFLLCGLTLVLCLCFLVYSCSSKDFAITTRMCEVTRAIDDLRRRKLGGPGSGEAEPTTGDLTAPSQSKLRQFWDELDVERTTVGRQALLGAVTLVAALACMALPRLLLLLR